MKNIIINQQTILTIPHESEVESILAMALELRVGERWIPREISRQYLQKQNYEYLHKITALTFVHDA